MCFALWRCWPSLPPITTLPQSLSLAESWHVFKLAWIRACMRTHKAGPQCEVTCTWSRCPWLGCLWLGWPPACQWPDLITMTVPGRGLGGHPSHGIRVRQCAPDHDARAAVTQRHQQIGRQLFLIILILIFIRTMSLFFLLHYYFNCFLSFPGCYYLLFISQKGHYTHYFVIYYFHVYILHI